MSDLTVERETAEKLKAAGWKKETKFHYSVLGRLQYGRWTVSARDWLPAPTVGELQEEVSLETLRGYFEELHEDAISLHDYWIAFPNSKGEDLARWFYDTLIDVKKLADVWMWREG